MKKNTKNTSLNIIKIKNIKKLDINKNFESYEDLIKKNPYLDYVRSKEKTRSDCQKKALIIQYQLLKYNYPSILSNGQFKYFVNESLKRKFIKLNYLVRLQLLLDHFIGYDNSVNIIKYLIENKDKNIKDIDIVKKILKLSKNIKNINTNYSMIGECKPWEFIFCSMSKYFFPMISKAFLGKPLKISEMKYLDIGCGYGNKTKLLAKYFKFSKNNIYGTDIENWGPYKTDDRLKKLDFNFKYLKDNIIDFPDNYFDVISSILTLHHVPNLTLMINEIKRVLKPGGIFILIEHNNHDKFDNMLTDIQHTLYSYIYDKDYKFIERKDNINRYFNYMEWDYIFNKHNFSYLKGSIVFRSGVYHYFDYDNQIYKFYLNQK